MSNIRFKPKRGRIRQTSPEVAAYFRSVAVDNTQEISRLKRNLRRALMEELTERQRQILLMHYGEEMSLTEIADTLDVCTSTVSRTLKRAEGNLRKFLKYSSDRIMLSLYDE